MRSATSRMFAPGCLCTFTMIARCPLAHPASCAFSAASTTFGRVAQSRTAAPPRYASTTSRNAAALVSWSFVVMV